MSRKRRLIIADTTLRDGAQTIGAAFNAESKLQVAEQLVRLGVDVIEIGFPASSAQDMESARKAAQVLAKKQVVLSAFARAKEEDIEKAWTGIGAHPMAMLAMLASVSDIHISSKFKSTRKEMTPLFCKMIGYAKSLGFKRIQVYLEDATRTDFSYIKELASAFCEAGADIISIPDTVSFVNDPARYGELFARLLSEAKLPKRAVLSSHTHNDKGLAVANTLAAIKAGAGMAECTINGLGERAGNASLGALLLNLYAPKGGGFASADYGIETGIRLKEYARSAQLVGELGGLGINYNEPLVGSAVISTSAGIHQDGILKNKECYFCHSPEDYGIVTKDRLFAFSMQSGRKGLAKALEDMGMHIDEETREKVFGHVLMLAQHKAPSSDDIRAIAMDLLEEGAHIVELKVCKAQSGVLPCSTEVLLSRSDTGETLRGIGYGDGPFDAFMEIVCDLLGLKAKILDYHDVVVGQGKEAQMQAFVRCSIDGDIYNARGVSTDIVMAGCRAFMKCLNSHFRKRESR